MPGVALQDYMSLSDTERFGDFISINVSVRGDAAGWGAAAHRPAVVLDASHTTHCAVLCVFCFVSSKTRT